MLATALDMNSPVALRYPRDEAPGPRRMATNKLPVGKAELLRAGGDVALIAIGPPAIAALGAAEKLDSMGIQARVINARFVTPIDEAAVVSAAAECHALVVIEENVAQGGFAGAVLECLARNRALDVTLETVSLPTAFVGHGKASDLRAAYGLNAQGIVGAALRAFSEPRPETAEQEEQVVIRQGI